MVRTLVIFSAVFALFSTVSAGPLINVVAKKHIGVNDITLKNNLNNLVKITNPKVNNIANNLRVASKRSEEQPATIRITKAFGVKGNKMMAKAKGAKGETPKK
ncbi:hypothetical protein BD770DRAFT_438770 [Pilaira anomala]|nr:hypothetical protein BD770DRAFT_438770 [Pilaira anomala]